MDFPYKEGRTGYQLFITGNENLSAFRQWIAVHFVSAERRSPNGADVFVAIANLALQRCDSAWNQRNVRSAKAARNVRWEEMHQTVALRSVSFIQLALLQRTASLALQFAAWPRTLMTRDLRTYADSELYWDKIVSIAYVGEKPTYDLRNPRYSQLHRQRYFGAQQPRRRLRRHHRPDRLSEGPLPGRIHGCPLLVERDKTEKVINFVSECRRMGVDVLPPDVNYSGLDFEIQLRPPDTPTMAHRDPSLGYPFPVPPDSAIRFGMAAIKNVGEGPVQVIIQARQAGGAFTRLEEFCDRVDLRQVNKRALECLIKAGAFDRWGRRSQLLAVIETMVAQSAGVHDARDSGQLSMFDLLMGDGSTQAHVTPIKLPDIDEVKGKEKLQWEKELLGVYSISHPLMQLGVDLKQVTTCSCAELDERYNGKGVTLAGIITNMRVLNTKKGDPMAFVALEDLQGSCEVVFFPKAYAENRDKLIVDSIIIAKGKAQNVRRADNPAGRRGEYPLRQDRLCWRGAPALDDPALRQRTDHQRAGAGRRAGGWMTARRHGRRRLWRPCPWRKPLPQRTAGLA